MLPRWTISSRMTNTIPSIAIAELKEEFEAMKLEACKNVAKVGDIFQDDKYYFMVGDLCRGGDFTQLKRLATERGVSLTEDWWRAVFKQCFEALNFMHEQAVMHCDIKEPNLMLQTDNYQSPHVMVIDFGVSTAMSKKDTGLAGGTPGYVPPETFDMGKWFPGGDVFSMGVVMLQMIIDRVPNDKAPRQGIFQEGCNSLDQIRIATQTRHPPTHAVPFRGLGELCAKCLSKDVRTRPRAPSSRPPRWEPTTCSRITPWQRPALQMTCTTTLRMISSREARSSVAWSQAPGRHEHPSVV